MAEGVNFVLVRTVFGAVLGMFYFGFNTGVVNAPAASIKQFTNSSYHQHYDSWLSGDKVETIFTVITSAFIGTAASHHTRMHSWWRLSIGMDGVTGKIFLGKNKIALLWGEAQLGLPYVCL